MADKKKLANMMQKRAPVAAPREVVEPVNLYRPAGTEPEKKQTSKQVKKQKSTPGKKFASYLRPESIKALKRIALDTDRNDYEVLQEAVDAYVTKREGKGTPS
jgi:hypothetical protein